MKISFNCTDDQQVLHTHKDAGLSEQVPCSKPDISPEAYVNDFRNRMPFHYIEEGSDGYYYWQYGSIMDLVINFVDEIAQSEDIPEAVLDVRINDKSVVDPVAGIANLGSMAAKNAEDYYTIKQANEITSIISRKLQDLQNKSVSFVVRDTSALMDGQLLMWDSQARLLTGSPFVAGDAEGSVVLKTSPREPNFAKASGTVLLGRGLLSSTPYQTVVGGYNEEHPTALFLVGAGSGKFNRKNALEVLADGSIHATGSLVVDAVPTKDTEVVRKLELNQTREEFSVALHTAKENLTSQIGGVNQQLSDSITQVQSEMRDSFSKCVLLQSPAQTIFGDISIMGRLSVVGQSYQTHLQEVFTKNDYIYLREGAASALPDGQYAGLQAVLYDGFNDGRLVFDNTGTARVGDIGQEQPLATRAESSALKDQSLLLWDAPNFRIIDSGISKPYLLNVLDNKSNATNLENGEGLDSLVQIYSGEIDDTHYGNTNTGESAVVFGEANNNSANRAVVWGKLNINAGQNIVGGLRNNVAGSQNIVAGQQNGGIGAEYNEKTGIATLPVNALGSLVLGGMNKVGDETNKPSYIIVAGAENTIGNAAYTITAGHSNYQYGYGTLLVGEDNVSYATNSVVAGSDNDLLGSVASMIVSGHKNNISDSSTLIVSGSGNTVADSSNSLIISNSGNINGSIRSIIGGHAPTVSASYVLAGGFSVNVTNSQGITWGRHLNNSGYAKAVFGEANDDKGQTTMLEVGNGARDASYRHNAFEVYRDGRAKVYGVPTENEDVVRKIELDKKIVVVDVTTMVARQEISKFLELSKQAFNGEIVIVGNVSGHNVIVNDVRYNEDENSARWVVSIGTFDGFVAFGGKGFGTFTAFLQYPAADGILQFSSKQSYEFNGEDINAKIAEIENSINLIYNGQNTNDIIDSFKELQVLLGEDATGATSLISRVNENTNKINNFSLVNGEGLDSIIQKYSGAVDSTHYGNTNTGESAVVFGEANNNSANRALMWGELNINSGQNIVGGLRNNVSGSQNIVAGQVNGGFGTEYDTVTQTATIPIFALSSLIVGGKNKVGVANKAGKKLECGIVSGANNEIGENTSYVLIGGYSNLIDNANYSIVGGSGNILGKFNDGSSQASLVVGKGNENYNSANIIGGHKVHNWGVASLLIGKDNYNYSYGTIIAGEDNTSGAENDNTIKDNIIGGQFNIAKASFSLIVGQHNEVNNPCSIIGGYYNIGKDNTLLEIGIGVSDKSPKNAFEVLNDGRAKVYKAPQDNDDVVRKLELDNAVATILDDEGATAAIDSFKELQELLRTDETGASGLINQVNENTANISENLTKINSLDDKIDKKIVTVDVETIVYLGTQGTQEQKAYAANLFMNYSKQFANGEIAIIGTMMRHNVVVNDVRYDEANNNARWIVGLATFDGYTNAVNGKGFGSAIFMIDCSNGELASIQRFIPEVNLGNGEGKGSIIQQLSGWNKYFPDEMANTNTGDYAAIFGHNNTNSTEAALIAGYYNAGKVDALFEIGNGTSEKPSNAFDVYKDGHAEIQKTTSVDNAVVNVAYMKQYIKDNFATLMAEYLEENAATAEDIKTIFNREA